MNEIQLMRLLIAVAKLKADGHFTIMRFTTNWRVQIGGQSFEAPTIEQARETIDEMPMGETFGEAVLAALEELNDE